jgi:signal transduction histidine kinase
VRRSFVSESWTERTALNSQDELRQVVKRTVSHDMRNALAVVLGRCELLLATEPLTAKGRTSVETVQRQGRRLNGLLDDLGKVLPELECCAPEKAS